VIGIDIGKNSFHIVGLDKRSSKRGGVETTLPHLNCESRRQPRSPAPSSGEKVVGMVPDNIVVEGVSLGPTLWTRLDKDV
jgi:hypothetical protein